VQKLVGTKKDPKFESFNFSIHENWVLKEPKSSLLLDGLIFCKESDSGQNILFLFQFKFKENPKFEGEDQISETPQEWLNFIEKVQRMEQFKGFKIVLVYFSNGNIPKKAKEMMELISVPIVIVEQSCLDSFFSPNLYPYVKARIHK
jgi:hypothetical protein